MLARFALLMMLLAPLGCGGSRSEGGTPTGTAEAPPGSIEALWRAPGDDIALIQGTSDYAPGENRIVFLVILEDGTQVARPEARVWVSRGMAEEPFQEATARLESVGAPGGSEDEVEQVYVTHVDLPSAGTYVLLAEPVGGAPVQGIANLEVKEETASPAVGAPAPPSNTPTLDSTGGDLAKLSTSTEPDRALYEHSVARTLRDGAPFVIAFATPKFCASRTCGPVVDILSSVREDFSDSGLRFIHVEIYAENDPTLGVNRWVTEWNLPTEPWVFVVDGDGTIVSKFEGAVSAEELRTAVEAVA